MPATFAHAQIVCLPSYREGLPKVLLEAAACARPLVATDAPGCREIVRHGENGFLVPLRDSAGLADAIEKLLDDPALRLRMGAKGREMVEAEFSEEQVARQTLAVYRELHAP
jgi:glycosyltransferase involved in cell wall biosynthesis